MTDLFTATAPTEPGYYWWKRDDESEPEVVRLSVEHGVVFRIGFVTKPELFGLWGPRIPLPIAPPVECYGIRRKKDGKFVGFDHKTSSRVRAENYPMLVEVVSGVFYPTAIVETNDAE